MFTILDGISTGQLIIQAFGKLRNVCYFVYSLQLLLGVDAKTRAYVCKLDCRVQTWDRNRAWVMARLR